MRFSHRYGYDPARKSGEQIVEDAPDWLREEFALDVLQKLVYVDQDSRIKNEELRPLGMKELNERLCFIVRRRMDDSDWDSWTCWEGLRCSLNTAEWWQFYDCVELIGEQLRLAESNYESIDFASSFDVFKYPAYQAKVNRLFEKHLVAWRLNSSGSFEMALPKDLSERIDAAVGQLNDEFQPARVHYLKAKQYILGTTKDTENSIKESISALESVCRVLYPKASTLGKALAQMKSEGHYPPRLISVFEKFYEYCNDEPAVRHGARVASRAHALDAELALHLSAAFIRYTLEVKRNKVKPDEVP